MQYKFAKEEEAFREELRRLPQGLPRKWRYGLIETADEDSDVAGPCAASWPSAVG